MKSIENFLLMIDIFGITYSFRYKEKEKYQTAFGGIIFLLFVVLALMLGIYYFIPFVNRKNYNIVYYTMNLAQTEVVNLFSSESNIAIGIDCELIKTEKRKVDELLDLKINYVEYVKYNNGSYIKNPKSLSKHKCTYNDFYNKYDAQFDYLGISEYECLDNKNFNLQGIYADKIFTYFEFAVTAKDTSKEISDEIERFLFDNDCKFQLIYTDIIIDLDNYENPIRQYLDSTFIQLNPSLFIKRNVYLMNQNFINDNFVMFVFGDDEEPEIKTLFSRYEEYCLYKGLKRFDSKPKDFNNYSKIYIRADLKKTIIKRKYQKFMEFYADASALLIAIYEILVIIFNYFNTFYGNHTLSKELFFFKDLEGKENFNILKNKDIIQELITLTDSQKKDSKNNLIDSDSNNSKIIKNYPPKKGERISSILDNTKSNIREVKIFNGRKKSKIENRHSKISLNLKGQSSFESKDNFRSFNNNNYDEKLEDDLKGYYNDNYQKNTNRHTIRNKNSNILLNLRNNNNFNLNESNRSNIDDYMSKTIKAKEKGGNKTIENSFNIFEVIITQFLKCCMSKNMRIKNDSNEKANELLFQKMDVITYIRNMILFDIVNQAFIDDNKKSVINFLCRPVINPDIKINGEFDLFYKNYKEKDFNKYYAKIRELTQKSNIDEQDKKLISISNEHLKTFFN